MGSCIGYGLLRDFILFSSGQFDNTSSLPNRTAAPEAICAQFVARNGTCGAGKRADREIGRSSPQRRGGWAHRRESLLFAERSLCACSFSWKRVCALWANKNSLQIGRGIDNLGGPASPREGTENRRRPRFFYEQDRTSKDESLRLGLRPLPAPGANPRFSGRVKSLAEENMRKNWVYTPAIWKS